MVQLAHQPTDEAAVRPELAELLFSSPWPTLVSLIVALITAAVLCGAFAPLSVLSWATLIAFAHAKCLLLWRSYHRALRDPQMARLWLARFAWHMLLIGIAWGTLALAVATAENGAVEVYILTLLMGMLAGGSIALCAYLPGVHAVIWPIVVPSMVALAVLGDTPHVALAGLLLIFALSDYLLARRLNGALVETFVARRKGEQLATELAIARVAAETAGGAKSRFLANMSHELRTPLNAIIGFAEVIEREMLGPVSQRRYREYAADIRASGRHLVEIIGDILDLAKVEAGEMTLNEDVVDIPRVMQDCIRSIEPRAAKAGVQMRLAFEQPLPPFRGDETRLRQIGFSLLSNAVKFSNPGGQVTVASKFDEQGCIVITIQDTGIGMSPAEIDLALKPFGQVASNHMHAHEGTGLGLPLAKALVDLHGGLLKIVSSPGCGTTVTVVLPPKHYLRESAHPLEQPLNDCGIGGRR